jgi:hypothetical protein
MEKELILLSEYCKHNHAELDFILRLEDEGLIKIEIHDEKKYLQESQLGDLDTFVHLYYDLSINVEGIDVIHNLLGKMRTMEQELSILRRQFGNDSLFSSNFLDEF